VRNKSADSITEENKEHRTTMTLGDLLKSGIVGMWKDRGDIKDSSEFARKLRKKAETRKL
jgi:hypothetical protein